MNIRENKLTHKWEPGLKGFTSQKKPELCNICEQEMRKSNFFNKNKTFRNVLSEYIDRLWLFHLST